MIIVIYDNKFKNLCFYKSKQLLPYDVRVVRIDDTVLVYLVLSHVVM